MTRMGNPVQSALWDLGPRETATRKSALWSLPLSLKAEDGQDRDCKRARSEHASASSCAAAGRPRSMRASGFKSSSIFSEQLGFAATIITPQRWGGKSCFLWLQALQAPDLQAMYPDPASALVFLILLLRDCFASCHGRRSPPPLHQFHITVTVSHYKKQKSKRRHRVFVF